MPTVHLEVEAKYDVDDDVPVPGLLELVAAARDRGDLALDDATPLAEGGSVEHDLGATYFDTAALDLAAAGLTLRRRTGGEDEGWHLKVPAGQGARSEIRVPLAEGEHTVPEQLQAMAFARTGGRPLVPVARVDNRRTVHRLVDATGRTLLELADDHVTARRLYPAHEPGEAVGSPRSWREVEVEVVDGPAELVAALDPVLRDRGFRPAASGSSKLRRALGLPPVTGADGGTARTPADRSDDGSDAPSDDPSDDPAPPAPESAGDVALAYVRAQVEQIRAQDLPVRLDAPGAVHAMRVATRRLRSALRTFVPVFREEAVRPVADELRWLAAALGGARDAEVVRERITAAVDADRRDDGSGPERATGEVSGALDRTLTGARDDLLRLLDGERYRALLAALGRLVEDPPLSTRAGRPAVTALPRRVARELAGVRAAMATARDAADPAEREEARHEARKAAKRARYAAEALAPTVGEDATRFAAAMEALQEALGEHLDAVGTTARLAELAATTSQPATAFVLGRLHAQEETRAHASLAEVDAAWRRASQARLRRWTR